VISVLAKAMEQIGPDDIQELIDSAVPEGERIEFKESLRTRCDGGQWVVVDVPDAGGNKA